MADYLMLVAPSANRVYADASVSMTAAELRAFAPMLSGRIGDPEAVRLGGVDYVGFVAGELSDRDVAYLSNLSSVYALFELIGDLLRPICQTTSTKWVPDPRMSAKRLPWNCPRIHR